MPPTIVRDGVSSMEIPALGSQLCRGSCDHHPSGERMRTGSGPGPSLSQTELEGDSGPKPASLQRGTMKDTSQAGSLGPARRELWSRGQQESQATRKVKVALGLSPDWALPSGLNPTTPAQAWAALEIRGPWASPAASPPGDKHSLCGSR